MHAATTRRRARRALISLFASLSSVAVLAVPAHAANSISAVQVGAPTLAYQGAALSITGTVDEDVLLSVRSFRGVGVCNADSGMLGNVTAMGIGAFEVFANGDTDVAFTRDGNTVVGYGSPASETEKPGTACVFMRNRYTLAVLASAQVTIDWGTLDDASIAGPETNPAPVDPAPVNPHAGLPVAVGIAVSKVANRTAPVAFTLTGTTPIASWVSVESSPTPCAEPGTGDFYRRTEFYREIPAGPFTLDGVSRSFDETFFGRANPKYIFTDDPPFSPRAFLCATILSPTGERTVEAPIQWMDAPACPAGFSLLDTWTYKPSDVAALVRVPGPGVVHVVGRVGGKIAFDSSTIAKRAGLLTVAAKPPVKPQTSVRAGQTVQLTYEWLGRGASVCTTGTKIGIGTFETAATSSKAPMPATNNGVKSISLYQANFKAKRATVLKSGGFTYSFTAAATGKAKITWIDGATPSDAIDSSLPHRSTTVLATGSVSVRAGKKAKLTVKLTAAGKAMLKGNKRLWLITRADFTAAGFTSTEAHSHELK